MVYCKMQSHRFKSSHSLWACHNSDLLFSWTGWHHSEVPYAISHWYVNKWLNYSCLNFFPKLTKFITLPFQFYQVSCLPFESSSATNWSKLKVCLHTFLLNHMPRFSKTRYRCIPWIKTSRILIPSFIDSPPFWMLRKSVFSLLLLQFLSNRLQHCHRWSSDQASQKLFHGVLIFTTVC